VSLAEGLSRLYERREGWKRRKQLSLTLRNRKDRELIWEDQIRRREDAGDQLEEVGSEKGNFERKCFELIRVLVLGSRCRHVIQCSM